MTILKSLPVDVIGALQHSFNMLWAKISHLLLPIILIVVFLSIGLWVVNFVSDKIGILVKKSKVDDFLNKVIAPVLEMTGTKINLSGVITESIRWFLIAVVLVAAFDMANLNSVIGFFNQILSYLPNVFVAALILIVGSLLANLAGFIVGMIMKGNFITTAKVAVSVLAFIAALAKIVTPIIGSLSQFIGHLSLSKLQADVLFIGVLVLVVYASRNAVTKTVENLYKT